MKAIHREINKAFGGSFVSEAMLWNVSSMLYLKPTKQYLE